MPYIHTYTTLHYTTFHCIALHYITLHDIASTHITSHHMTWHHITSIHATSNYITWHDLTVLVHYINPHHITSHHITSHYITLHYIHIYTYICVFSHRMYCILLQGFQNSAGPCWFPFICTTTDSWARWCAAASTCCGCASQGRDRWWDVMGIWL